MLTAESPHGLLFSLVFFWQKRIYECRCTTQAYTITLCIFIQIHAVWDAGRLVEWTYVNVLWIYYTNTHILYMCIFFSTADLRSMCINHVHLLFFLSLFFNRYILFGICVFTSQFESTFFSKEEAKKKTYDYVYILCDLYSDYLGSLVMMLPVRFEWCCEKKNRNTNSNNQFHIQIWNSKYWTLP